MKTSHRLGIALCCAALIAVSADAEEAKRNRLGVRFWTVGVETEFGEDESGFLTSVNYNRHFSDRPWIFTSKFGWGSVGENLIDAQFGWVRFWPRIALGAGYHVIDYSNSFSVSGGFQGTGSDSEAQHGLEVLAAHFGAIPDTDLYYRASFTWIPILLMEDFKGNGYIIDMGMSYKPGIVTFGAGYRRQITTFEDDSSWFDREFETTYSGLYVEALVAY